MQEALAFFFTFHNVSIKSAKIRWHHHIVMDFTFHNVSIKSMIPS